MRDYGIYPGLCRLQEVNDIFVELDMVILAFLLSTTLNVYNYIYFSFNEEDLLCLGFLYVLFCVYVYVFKF